MIIVHAKGNKEIGIGNIARSYELINYLSTKHNIVGVFECNKELFSRYKKDNIFQADNFDNSIKLIKKAKATIYICDLISPNKAFSDKLKEIGIKKIFHFNSIENGFEPDILFVTDDFDYTINNKDYDLYRGFKYYIIGKKIVKNRNSPFTPIKKIENILICFGGADPAFFTEYFAKTIFDSKYKYTIVLGPAMPLDRKKSIKDIKKPNISYIDSPSNMLSLYKNHDLLITLGGMMTYEAMCLGLPVSAVRWNYLEYIVKSFGEKNMVCDLGNIEDAYENLLNLDIKKLNKNAQNSFNIIDGEALNNIQKVVEKYL